MKNCEKCPAKNRNFDFLGMTLQTSCGAFCQRERVTLQTSCGAERVNTINSISKCAPKTLVTLTPSVLNALHTVAWTSNMTVMCHRAEGVNMNRVSPH